MLDYRREQVAVKDKGRGSVQKGGRWLWSCMCPYSAVQQRKERMQQCITSEEKDITHLKRIISTSNYSAIPTKHKQMQRIKHVLIDLPFGAMNCTFERGNYFDPVIYRKNKQYDCAFILFISRICDTDEDQMIHWWINSKVQHFLVANGKKEKDSLRYWWIELRITSWKPHCGQRTCIMPAAVITHLIYSELKHKGRDLGRCKVAEPLSRVSNTNTQWAAGHHYFWLNVLVSEGRTQLGGHQLDTAMLIH